MKYKIVTIGDASEDIFLDMKDIQLKISPRFTSGKGICFELGEKIPISKVHYDVGGTALNTAVGFARLGMKSGAIVALGIDSPAEKIINRLKDEGVNHNLIVQKKDISSHFSLIFNVGDERTIFVYRSLKDYSALAPKKGLAGDWLFLGPMGEGAEAVFDRAVILSSEKNQKIAWNPGTIQIEKGVAKFRQILQNTTALFLNREEAIKFIKTPIKQKSNEVALILSSYGPKIIVITDGREGASAFDGRRYYKIDALSHKRVDATGAGDSFLVGFLGFLILHGKNEYDQDDISMALRWGIVNSTSVVNQIGAQDGLLTRAQIEEELTNHPRLFVETY